MTKLHLSVSLHTGTRQTCPSTLSIIAFTFPLELTNFKPRRWHFQMFSFNPCWHTPSNIINQAAVGCLKECVVLAPAGCPVVLGLGAFRCHPAPEVGPGASSPASSLCKRCSRVLVCLRAGTCEFVHVFAHVLVRSRGPLAA